MSPKKYKQQYFKTGPDSKPVYRTQILSALISERLKEIPIIDSIPAVKHDLTRMAALDKLGLLDPKAENLQLRIREILQEHGFVTTGIDSEIIRHLELEIAQPLQQLLDHPITASDFPEEVQAQILPTPPEATTTKITPPSPKPPEPADPEVTQLAGDAKAYSNLASRLPNESHPALQFFREGLHPEHLSEVVSQFRQAFNQAGLETNENPAFRKLHAASEQFNFFARFKPEIDQAFKILHDPGKAFTFIEPTQAAFNLKIPLLGKLNIQAVSFSKSSAEFKLALEKSKAIHPLLKKAGSKLAQTAGGQAVKKSALALAKKLGISITSTGTAVIPGGQVIAAIIAVNQALDALEKIPVVGKAVKALRDITPWRVAKKGVKKFFDSLKKGKQEIEEGNPMGILRLGVYFAPLLIPVAMIAGTTGVLVVTGTVVMVTFGTAIVSRTAITASRALAQLALFHRLKRTANIFWWNWKKEQEKQRKKRRRRIIIGLIIGVLTIILLTIFIVVMIAGGAFMVQPRTIAETVFSFESDYILLSKTANPTAIENPSGPVQISYEITISARESPLTNVVIDNNTRIINPLTSQEFSITTAENGDQITTWIIEEEITGSFTLEYTVLLAPEAIEGVSNLAQIHDSWLFDTVTVTADIPLSGVTNERLSATARVRIGNAPDLWPTDWPVCGYITQLPYNPGGSHDPNGGVPNSIDFGGCPDEPIYATHDGIAYCREGNGYGYWVQLCSFSGCADGGGWETRYGHMPPGACGETGSIRNVTRGEQIGIVDDTGVSDGAHLHYELRGDPGLGTSILLYIPSGSPPLCTGG